MADLWHRLSAFQQDFVLLLALLLPVAAAATLLLRGYAPWPILRARIRRDAWVNVIFVLLIAVSVGTSIALLSAERGLRVGTAKAAEKFDLIVGAPGSELTLMLATVYLQPTVVPLLGGEILNELANDPRVGFAAPLAFGDSYNGAPIIGATADFVEHLGENGIEGRMFASPFEAIVGAEIALEIGGDFTPNHGRGATAQAGLHADVVTVVGRLPKTGSPWDNAIMTPIEGVWLTHGIGSGKDVDIDALQIGPPFDAELFPGTPAILVQAESAASAYFLQSGFNARPDAMAFFPATVLTRLYGVLGDVRRALQVLSVLTQLVVAASVLTALTILARLYRPQIQLLHILGAPGRFILALVWGHVALLIGAGTGLGLVLGGIGSGVLSAVLTAQTGIEIRASLSWSELHLAMAFLSAVSLVAVGLGVQALRQTRIAPLQNK